MPNIQFVEEEQFGRAASASRQTPKLVSLVMRLGLAKSEKAANGVLLSTAIVAAALAIYFFVSASSGTAPASAVPPGAVGATVPGTELPR